MEQLLIKKNWSSKRTCKDEFNIKFIYAVVLENWSFKSYEFLFLRADSHAQYEIRVYAEKMLDTVKKWVPMTHAAFLDYRVGAAHLSSKGIKIVKSMINGKKISYEDSSLGKREWNELMEILELKEKIIS